MPNLRKLLYPFSVLYHLITGFRNKLYDKQVLKSESYDFPVICVGNLNMGGTGKSPMIEYLLDYLDGDYSVASLSRGYKRKTKGFQMVQEDSHAAHVGDEPLQFKKKFPQVLVAVDANRKEGVERLKEFAPDIILLDDAFQHRRVKAGLNILLTAYYDLYTEDLLLPGGNLRESSSGAKRADIIVVTKCPPELSEREMEEIRRELKPTASQDVFFSSISYSDKIFSGEVAIPLESITSEYTLVTGIAKPEPLLAYLENKNIRLKHLKFPDHHHFSEKEISHLDKELAILTTEKDFMRLKDKLPLNKLYYLPIRTSFLANDELAFRRRIDGFINEK